jgi:hypothetical protein
MKKTRVIVGLGLLALAAGWALGCGADGSGDASGADDAGGRQDATQDSGAAQDSGATDTSASDTSAPDTAPADSAPPDAGPKDSGGPADAGPDTAVSRIVCDFAGDAGERYTTECMAAQISASLTDAGLDCNSLDLSCPTNYCCGAPYCGDPNSTGTATFLCLPQ